MLNGLKDELTAKQVGGLLKVALEDPPKQAAEAWREELLAALIEWLPTPMQHVLGADLLATFSGAGIGHVVQHLAADAHGAEALLHVQELSTNHLTGAELGAVLRKAKTLFMGDASAEERLQTVHAMLESLKEEELKAILERYGVPNMGGEMHARGVPNMGGEMHAREAGMARGARDGAREPPAPEGARDGAFDMAPMKRKDGSTRVTIGARRQARQQTRKEIGAADGSNPLASPSLAASPAPVEVPEEDESDVAAQEGGGSSVQHQLGGGASMAEMLRRKMTYTTLLSTAELLRVVGGSLAMKVDSDGASRRSERPRMCVRDELWRYLATRHGRRTDAVQALHNLAATLMEAATQPRYVMPYRVHAFRSLTGIATDSGGCWPPPQADFCVLCLHALFPAWGRQQRTQIEAALSAERLSVSTVQVLEALKFLVRDTVLLNKLSARVKAAATEGGAGSPNGKTDMPMAPGGTSASVDLDWFLTMMLQVWEDAQIGISKQLQSIFLEADDNGDGILQLDEFIQMIKVRKPNVTEGEAFKLYDEALALSEQMLGYETDAILAEAFIRTAIAHNLFADIASKLRSADDAVYEPPPGWSGGAGAVPFGSASPGGLAASSPGGLAGSPGGRATSPTGSPPPRTPVGVPITQRLKGGSVNSLLAASVSSPLLTPQMRKSPNFRAAPLPKIG